MASYRIPWYLRYSEFGQTSGSACNIISITSIFSTYYECYHCYCHYFQVFSLLSPLYKHNIQKDIRNISNALLAKQHNQRSIRGLILHHGLSVRHRSLTTHWEAELSSRTQGVRNLGFLKRTIHHPQLESLHLHCFSRGTVSSPDWKWSYPARRLPSALFPDPVMPNIITSDKRAIDYDTTLGIERRSCIQTYSDSTQVSKCRAFLKREVKESPNCFPRPNCSACTPRLQPFLGLLTVKRPPAGKRGSWLPTDMAFRPPLRAAADSAP